MPRRRHGRCYRARMERDLERADERAIEQAISDLLADHHDVAAAWLFGSRARGEEHSGSDVDIAVLLRDEPPRTLAGMALDLAGDLEERLERPVDLVVLNRAPADLAHRVLRDGRLVHDADHSARVRWTVRVRND